MLVATEEHGELNCAIDLNEVENLHVGTLKWGPFEIGVITSPSLEGVRSMFQTIAGYVDEGGMVRHGIIMLGYHNGDFGGDVMLVDGELLGSWYADDEEICYFTLDGETEAACMSISPWMLHDEIAGWLERR